MNKETVYRGLLKTVANKNERDLIKQTVGIWRNHLQHYKLQVLLGLLLKFLSNLCSNILMPILLGFIINHLAKYPQNIDRTFIYQKIILIIVLLVLSIIFEYYWNVVCAKYLAKSRSDLEQYVFNELLNKKYSFHTGSLSGAVVSQYNRFMSAYVFFHDILFRELFSIIINFSLTLIVSFYYSMAVGLAMLIWSIVYIVIILSVSKNKFDTKKSSARKISRTTGYFADVISNIITVKIFARENFEKNNFRKISNNKLHSSINTWKWSAKITALISGLMMVLNVTILVILVESLQQKAITIGVLVLIQAFTARISIQLWQLGNILRDLDKSFIDSGEFTEILVHQPKVSEPELIKKFEIKNGQIDIKNVSFEYPDDQSIPKFFKNLSLNIKPGEKIGIVGPSGSGKTTLIKLILRLAETTEGEVLIDGKNIKTIPHKYLRDAISYVPQEPILFHRTILENIKYANPKANHDEIGKAIRQSRSYIFIDKLPKGLYTVVGERGIRLSRGQRQRIALARSFLRPTPILILDEATSAIDSESEISIQKSLNQLTRSRTTLVIAHRFSTIAMMDRILFMSHGKIVEQGSHSELIAKNGAYAKLWNIQTSDFIEQNDLEASLKS